MKKEQTHVGDFMTKKVISVNQSESLKKVFELMNKYGILGVPVIDKKNKLVGIITESDLIKPLTTLEAPYALTLLGSVMYLDNLNDFNQQLKEHRARKVSDLMTKDVIYTEENVSLTEVIDKMSHHQLSRLPVVNKKGELTGIVTRTDIVHQLAKLNVNS